MAERAAFGLLTCHTPTIVPARLRQALAETLAAGRRAAVRVQSLYLQAADGRKLPSGLAATWRE
jgi:hypothetical protein